jgi:hypothetical protein
MAIKTKKNNKSSKGGSRNSEVKRILKTNLDAGTLAKEDIFFAQRFLNTLLSEEDDIVPAGDLSNLDTIEASPEDLTNPDRNEQDFNKALEPGTDPSSFDTKGTTPVEDFNNKYIMKAGEWVSKLSEFADFLNDPKNDSSLNKMINKMDRENSVFKGITGKTVNSIVKIAGEVQKLSETIAGYLSQAERKTKEMHKQLTVTD